MCMYIYICICNSFLAMETGCSAQLPADAREPRHIARRWYDLIVIILYYIFYSIIYSI